MKEDEDNLKLKIQQFLEKEITLFLLKGEGWCNKAYYVETRDGGKYIVKQERTDKRGTEQNNLVVEAGVIKQLYELGISVPVPRVVFVSKNLKMFGYEYLEGEILLGEWKSFSEEERIAICQALGRFHAEIGKKFTIDMAREFGIKIDDSVDFHPEVTVEYNNMFASSDIPEAYKALAREARTIFDNTSNEAVFQFIHNDAHHENVIIKDKNISGIIDFGNAEYGEIAKDFSRYIRDYPDYFQYIVSAYEVASGNKLSYKRLVTDAYICDLADIVENYRKGGENKIKADNSVKKYRQLIKAV